MKMILADDEPVIARGIQKLLDWNSLGIEIAGVYEEGKSALEGIVKLEPDIALLDISMPGMTGVEIIKECAAMNVKTKIIFISGFQDFEYAKSALTYGAVDYLLKPVISGELLNAVERCVTQIKGLEREQQEKVENGAAEYKQLIQVEETVYRPIYADIILPEGTNEQMEKLLRFSFASFLQEYVQEDTGITFQRKGKEVVIFKGQTQEQCLEKVTEMWRQSIEATSQQTFFVIGREVTRMSDIPGAFEECLAMQGFLFFASQMNPPVVEIGKSVFAPVAPERFSRVRDELVAAVSSKDTETFEKLYEQFCRLACRMSEGKKEDACYYFCSVVRQAEEKLQAMGITREAPNMKLLLEIGRSCANYEQLMEQYHQLLQEAMISIQDAAVSSEMQNLIKAKNYIEQHYHENLTLNILADEIHMNPYYFSAFFKKNAGENFKDYVSKVRIRHAVSLLVSTNKKTYEIALETGFADARAFTEAFQRHYGETPSAYRKRIQENG